MYINSTYTDEMWSISPALQSLEKTTNKQIVGDEISYYEKKSDHI